MDKPYLSVVMAAYNEEGAIGNTLLEIDKYLSKQNYTSEIVVVNDGSKDRTAEIVESYKNVIRNLRFIDNKENRGKGARVKQGMLVATGQYRIFVDADNAITIDQIEKFWPYIKEYDIVIGSIELKGAKSQDLSIWYRRLLGKLAKYLIRALTIWEIHDTQRAFKLFPEKAAQEIFSRQTIERWGFDIEVLVLAKKLGYKIKELPVTWINPGVTRVNFKAYLNTLRELMYIKWNLLTGKYNIKK